MQPNKIVMTSFISASLFVGMAYAGGSTPVAPSTFGGNGTIHFKGGVTDGACSIKAGTIDQTIALPVVKASLLKNGSEAGDVPFHITLENCSVDTFTKVTTKFIGMSGTNGAPSNSFSGSPSPNAAKNVGLKIKASDGTTVSPNTDTPAVNLVAGNKELDYTASYIAASSGQATAGDFDTTVNFTLTYQ